MFAEDIQDFFIPQLQGIWLERLMLWPYAKIFTSEAQKINTYLVIARQNLLNKYMFKVQNKSTRKRCNICSKLTTRILEQRCSSVFNVNFEHISRLSNVSIADVQQVNVCWESMMILELYLI